MSKKRAPGVFRAFSFVLFCMFVSISLLVVAALFSYAKAQQVADRPTKTVYPADSNIAASSSLRVAARQRPAAVRSSPALPAAAPVQIANPASPFGPRTRTVDGVWSTGSRIGLARANSFESFANKIKSAEDDEARQEAIDQARAALEKHYDQYVDGYEKQVSQMEERVAKLRDQLDKRKAAKERLVEMKLEMLTSQADGLGWPGDSPPAQSLSPFSTRVSSIDAIYPSVNRAPIPLETYAPSLSRVPEPDSSQFSSSQRDPSNTPIYAPSSNIGHVQPRLSFGPGPGPPVMRLQLKNYFKFGIELLENERYGEFLDRYMEPSKFRKAVKDQPLSKVALAFEKSEAETIKKMFKAALKDSNRSYTENVEYMFWELTIDGQKRKLSLVRESQPGSGNGIHQWYVKIDTDLTSQ